MLRPSAALRQTTPHLVPPIGRSGPRLDARLERLEKERRDLWTWIFHLERLAQAGLMAGGLAHDSRNLLAAISGQCQLAEARGEMGSAARDDMRRAVELCNRLGESLSVFLTFARGQGPSGQACSVTQVVHDAVRFAAPTLRNTQVRLETRVEGALGARCEPTLLLQVLVNLVLNSVRAIDGAEGCVTIAARALEDGRVALEVSDDGPGVPAELRSRLFQPFVTGTLPRPGASGGTGLGLYVARRIVEEQGGTIELLPSQARGASFQITLQGPKGVHHA